MNLILQLSLFLLGAGFTRSNKPSLDLECLNDYDTEMVCLLSSEKLNNCPEYELTASFPDEEVYNCSFERVSSNRCNCKLQIQGFVITEIFKVSLCRRGEKLLSKEISTEESIKPKRPTILSVNLTQNGGFNLIWDTHYTPNQKTFFESLSTELIYGINRSAKNVVVHLEKGRTEYEIVGRQLQPNSKYFVMARVSTDYNNNSRFSEYSQPYEFSTPTSIQDIFKIIIPVSCVILIIFISTLFYCYVKTIKQWWDKIPVPKIASNFEKTVPHLPSFGKDISPVCLETSKLDPIKEKMWMSTAQVVVSSAQDSLQSFGKSGNSSQVIYAETVSGDLEGNATRSEAQCELLEDYKSADQVQSNNMDIQRKCANSSCSSFSNRCYLGSESSGSCFQSITHPAYPSNMNENENVFSALPKNLDTIPTDFEYGPCNGSSLSADSTQFTPFSPETVVVPGYQSVNELSGHGNKPDDQVFISYHNDINLIMAKNLQSIPFPACDNVIIPVDDGYQSFPGSDQNTWGSDHTTEIEQESAQTAHHNLSSNNQQVHAPPFKSLCGPVLNISPGIQIDLAYQKV